MVIEALVMVVVGLFTVIGEVMPTIELPGWVAALNGHVAQVSAWAAPLGNWLPFGAMGNGVAFVMACLAVAFAIRLTRIIASFFTGGGGSAG